jgi:maleylacetate reductase
MGLEGQHAVLPDGLQSHVLNRCTRPAERNGASYRVVLKVQQVVGQPSMRAAQLLHLIRLSVRLALASEQLPQRSSSAQPGQVGAAEVRVQCGGKRNQRQPSSCRDHLSGSRVPLHVEIHVRSPLREAWRGRLHPATHDDNLLPRQAAGAGDLEQCQVGVRTDGDQRRPSVKAALEQIQRGTRWRRPGSNVCRPMPLIIDGVCPAKCRRRDFRPGRQRNVLAIGEAQQIPHVRRPTASRVGHGGDARDVHAGPAEQHGQGACVVGVATQVCVEVNAHPARMPEHKGGSCRYAAAVRLPGADAESFSYSAPVLVGRAVRVVFGPGSLAHVASEARTLGTRIMIISGRHEADAAEAVSAQLGDDLAWRIPEVVPHVPVEVAARAIEAARGSRADAVVSIGGGSATGLAKAVARESGLPIIAVPTTYAGSEMTSIWGQSHQGEKTTGRDPRVLPRIVVYDPILTITMPAELSAASGMNALAHAVESLYAPDSTSQSSEVAEEAIRALAHGLPRVVMQPEDLKARTEALRGAWLAGWALGSTSMGLHHKLAHVLGGTYQLPHAGVHSALLPQVAAFNAPYARGPFSRAARALGATGPEEVGPALFELATQLKAPTSLADLGLKLEAIDVVAHVVAGAPVSNPRAFTEEDVRYLLQQAYLGKRPLPERN